MTTTKTHGAEKTKQKYTFFIVWRGLNGKPSREAIVDEIECINPERTKLYQEMKEYCLKNTDQVVTFGYNY